MGTLLLQELTKGRENLLECCTNLESVADYCCENYERAEDKKGALEETMNYTTQSLGSVAYQINLLASNFLGVLGEQAEKLKDMEGSIHQLNMHINIHQEKVARRAIGSYTSPKEHVIVRNTRNPGLVYPDFVEKPTKYVRRSINYNVYDDIGHGGRPQNSQGGGNASMGRRVSASAAQANHPIGSDRSFERPPNRTGSLGPKGGGDYTMKTGSNTIGRSGGLGGIYRTANIAPHQPVNAAGIGNYATSNVTTAGSMSGHPDNMQQQQQGHYLQSRRSSGSSVTSQQQMSAGGGVNIGGQGLPRQTYDASQAGYYQAGQTQYMAANATQNLIYSTGATVNVNPNPYQPGLNLAHPTQPSQYAHSTPTAMAVIPPNPINANMNYQSSTDNDLPPPPTPEINPAYNFSSPQSPNLPPPPQPQMAEDGLAMPPPPMQQYADNGGQELSQGNYGYNYGMQYQQQQHYDIEAITHLKPKETDQLQPRNADDPPWAPDFYIQKVYSLFEYIRDKNDELSFCEGALIYVIKKNDDGWWEGVMDNVTGLFPGNYVESES